MRKGLFLRERIRLYRFYVPRGTEQLECTNKLTTSRKYSNVAAVDVIQDHDIHRKHVLSLNERREMESVICDQPFLFGH